MSKSSPGFLRSDPCRHELSRRLAPFSLVLGCSRPLVGVDAESSEVLQETPRLLFFLPPTQPAPLTTSSNMMHFSSLVSSMRAINPVNRIRLLHIIASMPLLPVLVNKRVQIGNPVVGAIVLSPTDAASQQAVVGSAQRIVVVAILISPSKLLYYIVYSCARVF